MNRKTRLLAAVWSAVLVTAGAGAATLEALGAPAPEAAIPVASTTPAAAPVAAPVTATDAASSGPGYQIAAEQTPTTVVRPDPVPAAHPTAATPTPAAPAAQPGAAAAAPATATAAPAPDLTRPAVVAAGQGALVGPTGSGPNPLLSSGNAGCCPCRPVHHVVHHVVHRRRPVVQQVVYPPPPVLLPPPVFVARPLIVARPLLYRPFYRPYVPYYRPFPYAVGYRVRPYRYGW